MFASFDIAASGLTAQRLRLDVIANNLANAETTRTADGGPYVRQLVVFAPREVAPFSYFLGAAAAAQAPGHGVRVEGIVLDPSPPRRVYQPGHPDADEAGYVLYPNVNVVKEMVDMISASRAYEANAAAFNAAKGMALKALELGRR
ncbi:MAG: flagellar basal-body rod protein FlgC [Bacillota bacterium]|jgi:flagellar basal-body rod protein FlgC|nr:flagellar basal-body rod protein FlgC [Bacillota bacterium]MDK2882715.1 flagellar basal-body rod protein FlgC [Bacillota bacterium]